MSKSDFSPNIFLQTHVSRSITSTVSTEDCCQEAIVEHDLVVFSVAGSGSS